MMASCGEITAALGTWKISLLFANDSYIVQHFHPIMKITLRLDSEIKEEDGYIITEYTIQRSNDYDGVRINEPNPKPRVIIPTRQNNFLFLKIVHRKGFEYNDAWNIASNEIHIIEFGDMGQVIFHNAYTTQTTQEINGEDNLYITSLTIAFQYLKYDSE
jgi:hypothetical protein